MCMCSCVCLCAVNLKAPDVVAECNKASAASLRHMLFGEGEGESDDEVEEGEGEVEGEGGAGTKIAAVSCMASLLIMISTCDPSHFMHDHTIVDRSEGHVARAATSPNALA